MNSWNCVAGFIVNFRQITQNEIFYALNNRSLSLRSGTVLLENIEKMKVTPRLPIHGKYSAFPQFREMRYIRFGNQSRTTAIVFGFLEELLLPQHKSRRNEFSTRISKHSGLSLASTQVLKVVLDQHLAQEHHLAIWNTEGFYSTVISALMELFGQQRGQEEYLLMLLNQEYKLDVLKYDAQVVAPAEIRIFTDFWVDSVVLVYRNWTMDSFLVTACGHIHVKAQLFARARERMGKPMIVEEFSRKQLVCSVNSCTQDISLQIFQEGKAAASPSSTFPQAFFSGFANTPEGKIVEKYRKASHHYGKCTRCGNENTPFECRLGHKICPACFLISYLAHMQLICPCCDEEIDNRHVTEIQGILRFKAGWEEPVTLMCSGCHCCFPLESFAASTALEHKQLFCADCFSRFSQDSKRAASSSHPCRAAQQNPTQWPNEGTQEGKCLRCKQERPILEFRFYLYGLHSCYICDGCYRELARYSGNTTCQWGCSFYFSQDVCASISRVTNQTNMLEIYCLSCKARRSIEHFCIYQRLSHWWKCKICDICVTRASENGPPAVCSSCKRPFSLSDTEAIRLRMLPLSVPYAHSEFAICAICERLQPAIKYQLIESNGHQCRVCEDCLLASQNLSSERAICPGCFFVFDLNAQSNFLQAEATSRTKPEMIGINKCQHCHEDKPQFYMRKCAQLYHGCVICDQCLTGRGATYCLVCSSRYESHDCIYLSKVMRLATTNIPQGTSSALKKCQCGREVKEKEPHCSLKCSCFLCFFGHFLLTERPDCFKCKEHIAISRLQSPREVKCSRCLQTLSTSTHSLKRVCGICPNDCILCYFCIKYDHKGRALCKDCLVQLKYLNMELFSTSPQSFPLGCYCGETGGYEEQISCGHKVHHRCLHTLYSCRLCDKFIKAKPKCKTLRDYWPGFT
jgi:hypothetical protein